MSNGGWRPSTLAATCFAAGVILYLWTQLTHSPVTATHRTTPASVYDRPGTLSTHATRLDGNLTGELVPVWSPFHHSDLPADHGRLLEKLLDASRRPERIVDPDASEEISTVLFFGDSNERGVVDELCIKLGSYANVVSSTNPPARSDRWHADSHVCDVKIGNRRLRFASFMSYGVLIERDSKLWEKKVELNGPWAVEERIALAKEFVAKMGWEKLDLIVFNSNLWDLMYLHDTHIRLDTVYEFSLPQSTLDSYISRSVFALSELSRSFPSTSISFRTLHPLHPGRAIDFFNLRRIVQLNQAAVEVVSRANDGDVDVRLFDLGKVLEGWPTSGNPKEEHNILKDKVHLGWNPGLWMYVEMVLDVLERGRGL